MNALKHLARKQDFHLHTFTIQQLTNKFVNKDVVRVWSEGLTTKKICLRIARARHAPDTLALTHR